MLWEGKPLREVTEADIRALVASGLEEHMQLEYKSQLYSDDNEGRKEFLLDIGMFANSSGGILLIGIPERRDDQGQPTGAPDPNETLGIEIDNPEAVLLAYDARVTASIEERLPLESVSIAVGDKRRVLAIRVQNSLRKPHSVRHKGEHIYFPSRRERHRYYMTVREIKEMVMRTASRIEQAAAKLRSSFNKVVTVPDQPYFIAGMIPVFFEDFLVDVRARSVHEALLTFSRTPSVNYCDALYTFHGLERHRSADYDHTVRLWRNGLLNTSCEIPTEPLPADDEPTQSVFTIRAIDILLRQFVIQAANVYEVAGIAAPYLLIVELWVRQPLTGRAVGLDGFTYHTKTLPRNVYILPVMQIDDLSTVDRIIRPFCDQVHQMFGLEGSPCFDRDGRWTCG